MRSDASSDISRLYAGPFPALEARLIERYFDAAGRDPDREHVLLVPSNELREHLLKRLASVPGARSSFAGASLVTLYDFVLRLLKQRGIFPKELPPARMSAATLAAVRETYVRGGGDFGRISATPGFIPAIARTLSDLEEGWIGDAELSGAEHSARERGDAAKSARWAEWRRLRTGVERKVRAMGGMTRRRIFQEAVAGFERPGYPFRVTLYGFYDFTRLQWTLVDRLLSSGLLDEVYFPGLFDAEGALLPSFLFASRGWDRMRAAFEGNVEFLEDGPAAGVAEVRERIFSPRPRVEPGPPPFHVLSAPHAEGEMRLAARRVRRWLDEDPGATVFVAARKVTPEAMADWERAAAEYGIPTAGRLDVPLASVPPVRLLLRMVEAVRDDYPRRTVIDVLSSPYRRFASEDGKSAPRPDLWDILSREFLIVSGPDWETRLSRPPRRIREEDGADADERAAQLSKLSVEVAALRASLSPVREAGGYASLAGALRGILTREFQVTLDDTPEGERDRRAVEALLAILSDLSGIPDEHVPWPGIREGLEGFASLLAGQRLFVGERGGMRVPGAVVFGDVFAMRGVTADRALVLSVNEDAVPAQLEEDPLLPDDDREELNRELRRSDLPDALSLRRRNAAEEKLLFALPAASVRKQIAFSVLRADAAGATKRPSRYLLHLLSRFAGPSVFSEEWESASGAVAERLPRSPFAALDGEGPRSPRERTLSAWRSGERSGAAAVPWGRIRRTLSAWGARAGGSPSTRVPACRCRSLTRTARRPWRSSPVVRTGTGCIGSSDSIRRKNPRKRSPSHLSKWGRSPTTSSAGWGRRRARGRDGGTSAPRPGRPYPGSPRKTRPACRAFSVSGAARWSGTSSGSSPWSGTGRRKGRDGKSTAWRRPSPCRGFPRCLRSAGGSTGSTAGRRERRGWWITSTATRSTAIRGEDPRRPTGSDTGWHTRSRCTFHGPGRSIRRPRRFPRSSTSCATISPGKPAPAWEEVRRFVGVLPVRLARHRRFRNVPAAPPSPFPVRRPVRRPRYCDACPFKDHCRVSPAFDGSEVGSGALASAIAREPALGSLAAHRPGKG